MQTKWLQFRDYNYEASLEGEIRNKTTGKILKQRQKKEGYLIIDIKIDKCVNKTFIVHRIIAEVFLGKKERGWEVDHINKIRNDNRAKNLRWLDKSENSSNRTASGILKEEVLLIIDLYKNGETIENIYLKINKKIKIN